MQAWAGSQEAWAIQYRQDDGRCLGRLVLKTW